MPVNLIDIRLTELLFRTQFNEDIAKLRFAPKRSVGSCTAYRESRHSPSMLLAGFVSIGVEQGARISTALMF
jgi:hypothetical protein